MQAYALSDAQWRLDVYVIHPGVLSDCTVWITVFRSRYILYTRSRRSSFHFAPMSLLTASFETHLRDRWALPWRSLSQSDQIAFAETKSCTGLAGRSTVSVLYGASKLLSSMDRWRTDSSTAEWSVMLTPRVTQYTQADEIRLRIELRHTTMATTLIWLITEALFVGRGRSDR